MRVFSAYSAYSHPGVTRELTRDRVSVCFTFAGVGTRRDTRKRDLRRRKISDVSYADSTAQPSYRRSGAGGKRSQRAMTDSQRRISGVGLPVRPTRKFEEHPPGSSFGRGRRSRLGRS